MRCCNPTGCGWRWSRRRCWNPATGSTRRAGALPPGRKHLLDGGIETDSADQLHDRGVRFHESLVEASGNAFFIDAIRRVNRVRRLLSYRSMRDRKRYREHCEQHLRILDLLERERNQEASDAMREHLSSTLRNIALITPSCVRPTPGIRTRALIRGHRPARPP